MADFLLKRLSYGELRDNAKIAFDDRFRMISEYLSESVKNTLFANPNLVADTQSAVNLVVCDGIIVGRNMLMPTKLKIRDKYCFAQSGGSYEICDKFRGKGLGTKAFKDSIYNSEYDLYIGQLYSSAAAAIVKKLGLIIFELPAFYKLCNSRIVFEAKGFKGLPLKLCAKCADVALKIIDIPNIYRLKKIRKRFCVKKLDSVPEWVNEMTLHDGHEFMEVHDTHWLQWCLDYKFTSHPRDTQSFFAVYDKKGEPKGFFMTKERFEKSQGIYRNIVRGTIVEWGSSDENLLSEADLNLMAVFSFDKDVDNITTVLASRSHEKKLKRMGFIRHGNYQMSVKPGRTECEDLCNPNKWRIRYGGCNTIIY